jgi:hypothetical protein
VVALLPIAIEGVTIDVIAPFPIAIEGVAIDVVAPPQVAIKGVHWAKDGPKFVCKVDGCDASYITKYNLVRHLRTHHMRPWSQASMDAHIYGGRVQGFKIT